MVYTYYDILSVFTFIRCSIKLVWFGVTSCPINKITLLKLFSEYFLLCHSLYTFGAFIFTHILYVPYAFGFRQPQQRCNG